jgi:hypothetical protein
MPETVRLPLPELHKSMDGKRQATGGWHFRSHFERTAYRLP